MVSSAVPASVAQGTSAVRAGLFVRGRRVQPVKLYIASILSFSTLVHDVMTESTPTGVTRAAEMRFSSVLWHDGQTCRLLWQAVDDSGHAVTNSVIQSVWPKDQLFFRDFAKKTKFRKTPTSCGWPWDTSQVVIPLLDDADFSPSAKACVTFELDIHADEGSNTGSGSPMRDGTKEQSDRVMGPLVTAP